jgi:p-hydroxybenzoate 3-monooxygenase
VRDLVAARLAAGGEVIFEADAVQPRDFHTAPPYLTFSRAGETQRLDCDFIAGCDGFHGFCRDAIPTAERAAFERDYPFGWLGILADAAPLIN